MKNYFYGGIFKEFIFLGIYCVFLNEVELVERVIFRLYFFDRLLDDRDTKVRKRIMIFSLELGYSFVRNLYNL